MVLRIASFEEKEKVSDFIQNFNVNQNKEFYILIIVKILKIGAPKNNYHNLS